MDVITFPVTIVVYRFHCMALFHSQTRRHIIKGYKSAYQSLIYKLLLLKCKDGSKVPSSLLANCPGLSPTLSIIPIAIISFITVTIVILPVGSRATLGAYNILKYQLIKQLKPNGLSIFYHLLDVVFFVGFLLFFDGLLFYFSFTIIGDSVIKQ